MLVNSIVFWAFFLVVLLPYFSVLKKVSRWQNLWILVASYFFYGYADWKMIPLLLAATIVFYFLGIFIEERGRRNEEKDPSLTLPCREGTGKLLMVLGIVLGAGMLLYFKYMNFFIE